MGWHHFCRNQVSPTPARAKLLRSADEAKDGFCHSAVGVCDGVNFGGVVNFSWGRGATTFFYSLPERSFLSNGTTILLFFARSYLDRPRNRNTAP